MKCYSFKPRLKTPKAVKRLGRFLQRHLFRLAALAGLVYLAALLLALAFGIKARGQGRFKPVEDSNPKQDPQLDKECQCKSLKNVNMWNESSYCSDHATLRGWNQRIISYSLFGTKNSRYSKGIESNLSLMEKHYPGYLMRIYHDRTWKHNKEELQELCHVFCNSDLLDLCNVNKLVTGEGVPLSAKFGSIWRFSPLKDRLVSEWHSRDLDSRLSSREAIVVSDWLKSNKTFHIMRDHTHHVAVILGGLFGMRLSQQKHSDWTRLFELIMTGAAHSQIKSIDQYLLKWYLWPLAKVDMVAHDSHQCEVFPNPNNRPWPIKRVVNGTRNFVGSTWSKDKLLKKCPAACRPTKHMDWLYC